MMSSATSINRRRPGLQTRHEEAGLRTRPTDAGFHVWHFFVLLSLIPPTVAVIMARQTTADHLVLFSLMIATPGLPPTPFYRPLAPLPPPTQINPPEPT